MIKTTPPMTREEEHELIARAKAGDDAAKARIVSSLVPLVAKEARRWTDNKTELDDLVQVGSRWILRAIEKFEFKKGVRFSTYAGWWWCQGIRKYARIERTQGRSGARSVLLGGRYGKLKKTLDELRYCEGNVTDELAKRANVSKQIAEGFINLHKRVLSLNVPINGSKTNAEYETDWINAIPCNSNQEHDLHLECMKLALSVAIRNLTDRERHLVQCRYLSGRESSLTEIGRSWGLSRERVRQIESNALAKMRVSMTRWVRQNGITA